MAKPAIITVDDDPAVLAAVTRDLRPPLRGGVPGLRRAIGRCSPGRPAVVERAGARRRPHRLRSTDAGDDRSRAARPVERSAPDAKLVLLTAYADTDVAIRAINDIDLDYYLMKPWDPPEEKLYPIVDDLLADWRRDHPDDRRRSASSGHRWSRRSHEIKTFLARNYVPYRVARSRARRRSAAAARRWRMRRRPICRSSSSLTASRCARRRTLDVADALGLRTSAEKPLYDLCIVGGGPAGLAAAVYGASEGLGRRADRRSRARRSGRSERRASRTTSASRKGLSGADLAARAMDQVRTVRGRDGARP